MVNDMNRSFVSYHRVLYKWVVIGENRKIIEVIKDGFTSQKSAMNWLKENNLKGKGYTLFAYDKK